MKLSCNFIIYCTHRTAAFIVVLQKFLLFSISYSCDGFLSKTSHLVSIVPILLWELGGFQKIQSTNGQVDSFYSLP